MIPIRAGAAAATTMFSWTQKKHKPDERKQTAQTKEKYANPNQRKCIQTALQLPEKRKLACWDKPPAS